MDERRRMRMVSFRVSPHEFELLKVRSEVEGARSISDSARVTLCRPDSEPVSRETKLEAVVDELQRLRAALLRFGIGADEAAPRRMVRASFLPDNSKVNSGGA
jgi:hypothetical protein